MSHTAWAIVLLLAACSGDATTTTMTESTTPVVVAVEMDDFSFTPAEVSVPPLTSVRVTVGNPQSASDWHTWTVLSAGDEVTTATELDESRILFRLPAPPGSRAAATFFLPPPGIYQIICLTEGHLELGMTGTLVVSG